MNNDSSKQMNTDPSQVGVGAGAGGASMPPQAQGAVASPSMSAAQTTPVIKDSPSGNAMEHEDQKAVAEAEKIIEATREDPYRQTNEIAKFKVEYMKNRYGKVLKTE